MAYETLITLVVLAVIVEFTTEIFKTIFNHIHGSISRIAAILIGTILCLATQSGILDAFNINIIYPQVDYILTGVIISRGANIIHDLISLLDIAKAKL